MKDCRKEKDIEKEILAWLNWQAGCKAWKNKSTGTYDPVAKTFRANRSKFSENGTSDILGIWQGKMLCIEVKSATGRATPEQKAFLETMAQLGAITILAKSLDDVLRVLKPDACSSSKEPCHPCGK